MEIKEYKLGDICIVKNNLRSPINISSRKYMEKTFPYYGANGIIDYVNFYKINFDCLLIAEDGSVLTQDNRLIIHYIYKNKISVSNHAHIIQNNPNIVLLKYLFYSLKKVNAKKFISGSVQQKLTLKNLLIIKIKLPNIQTQQAIINIIEPKEELFLKFNNIIDITSLENFNKTWSYLINIIEPFEKLKIKLNNKIDKLKFILNNFEDDIDNKFIFLNKNNICTGKRNADFASENGKYRFFTCSINKKQYCNSYKFDDEVILLSGNGDVGEIQYYKGKFDAYQRTYIIQHELIGNIYYSLLKNKKMFLKKSNGSVVKFLTLSTILSIKISNNRFKNKIRYEIIKLIFYYDLIIESISKIINNLIEIYV